MNPRSAVLNYHRVVPDGTESKFHDLSRSRFRSQMELLAARARGIKDGGIILQDALVTYLTFDDGTPDHVYVGDTLADLGLVGVFFLITGRLDSPASLTSASVRDLRSAGHRIGSHSVSHDHLTKMTDDGLWGELVDSRRQLEEIVGEPVDWLAPPGGHSDQRVTDTAERVGYKVVRTMEWGYATLPPHGVTPTLPVLSSYNRDQFTSLIEGRAPLWRYRLKERLKGVLGEERYVRVRDAALRNHGHR